MWLLLPVAGISISAPLLVGMGLTVGVLSGLFGVGGGFLLTPALILIGIPATVAAASDSCQIVAASSSGVAAHSRLGNVDLKMGGILLVGGLAGAEIGVRLIRYLRLLGEADLVIEIAYVLMLGSLGGLMLVKSLRNLRKTEISPREHRSPRAGGFLRRLPFQMDFPKSGVRHSVIVPVALCALVGILATIMGVGGGFIMLPMMVYLLKMPTHVAVGTSLFQVLILCCGVTFLQATTNTTVDLTLALLLAAGSAVGAQIGARLSKLFTGVHLILMLAILVLLVAAEMVVSLISTPSSLLEEAMVSGRRQQQEITWEGMKEADAAGPPLMLQPKAIKMGTFYHGTQLHVEGSGKQGSEIVIVVRGPHIEETFNKKVRVGPLWINSGKVHISRAPSLFLSASSRSQPVSAWLSREVLDQYELDERAVQRRMHIEIEGAPFADELARENYHELKTEKGVYRFTDGGVCFGTPRQSVVPYWVQLHWPKTAPPGQYEVSAYEYRDGQIFQVSRAPLPAVLTGLPARIHELATRHAPVYGLLAVIITLLAGFGIAFVSQRASGGKKQAQVELDN